MEDEEDREDQSEDSLFKIGLRILALIAVSVVVLCVIERGEPFFNWLKSCITDVYDILDTPLSCLTISKIVTLLFSAFIGFLIWLFCFDVLKKITRNDND